MTKNVNKNLSIHTGGSSGTLSRVSSGASSYYLEDAEDYFRALRKQGLDDSFTEEAQENGHWWARHFDSLREYELYKFCNELPIERALEGVDITT